jgi:hypothetical protein
MPVFLRGVPLRNPRTNRTWYDKRLMFKCAIALLISSPVLLKPHQHTPKDSAGTRAITCSFSTMDDAAYDWKIPPDVVSDEQLRKWRIQGYMETLKISTPG